MFFMFLMVKVSSSECLASDSSDLIQVQQIMPRMQLEHVGKRLLAAFGVNADALQVL